MKTLRHPSARVKSTPKKQPPPTENATAQALAAHLAALFSECAAAVAALPRRGLNEVAEVDRGCREILKALGFDHVEILLLEPGALEGFGDEPLARLHDLASGLDALIETRKPELLEAAQTIANEIRSMTGRIVEATCCRAPEEA
jgi:hypothetical protein